MPSSSSCNRVVVRTRSASRKLHLVAREVRIGLQDGLGATFLRAFAHGELSVPAAQKEGEAMSRRASRSIEFSFLFTLVVLTHHHCLRIYILKFFKS